MGEKAVFIFGAGAVLDWGGPLTLCKRNAYERIPEHDTGEIYNRPCCLTHLLLVTGFYAATGERITQRIYDRLKKDDPNAYVNFETILNIVEDLYAYWAARSDKEKNSLYDLIDVTEDLRELHNFTIISSAHHYSIEVPGFTLLDGATMIHNDIDSHVKYYELLINELLSGIVGHISKYAYASSTHQQFSQDINLTVTGNFRKWMQTFIDSGRTLRLYTLNYDDIFKRITESDTVTVFDGFFPGHEPDNYQAEPDLKRIVTDTNTHCHYNLHGSWSWEVDEYNENQLHGYRYRKSIPGVVSGSAASIVLEKGKRILLTNIISGYQKVQKTATSPFRQYFSTLDYDCLEATDLYLIGYSYGDEHVDDIIRNARRRNPELKITLINPSFDDLNFALRFLSNWGLPQSGFYEKAGEKAVVSRQFKVLALTETFGEYLAAEAASRQPRFKHLF